LLFYTLSSVERESFSMTDLSVELRRRLRLAGLNLDESSNEMTQAEHRRLRKGLADFFAGQVRTLKDSDVAYLSYILSAMPRDVTDIYKKLHTAAMGAYRDLLVEWFTFALLKRANAGGGGSGIKKIEQGLTNFVQSLPEAVLSGQPPRIELPAYATKYIQVNKLDAISRKITSVVAEDAQNPESGLWTEVSKAAYDVEVKWYQRMRIWYIPKEYERWTRANGRILPTYGFYWSDKLNMWVADKITNQAKKDFIVEGPGIKPQAGGMKPPTTNQLSDWFFGTWLKKNIGRFTKLFSGFARSSESSYDITFDIKDGVVSVTIKRNITNVDDAIEELRFRYIDKSGREPWLETMEKFLQLRGGSAEKLLPIIDRINNLQHSNGLFMEHFPKRVQGWYGKFLNAKYNAPTATDLARYLRDGDLRELIMFDSGPRQVRRQRYPSYETMEKDLPPAGVNWRERGYPRKPGTRQVRRDDPAVQEGLTQRELRRRARAVIARFLARRLAATCA